MSEPKVWEEEWRARFVADGGKLLAAVWVNEDQRMQIVDPVGGDRERMESRVHLAAAAPDLVRALLAAEERTRAAQGHCYVCDRFVLTDLHADDCLISLALRKAGLGCGVGVREDAGGGVRE